MSDLVGIQIFGFLTHMLIYGFIEEQEAFYHIWACWPSEAWLVLPIQRLVWYCQFDVWCGIVNLTFGVVLSIRRLVWYCQFDVWSGIVNSTFGVDYLYKLSLPFPKEASLKVDYKRFTHFTNKKITNINV